MNTLRLATAAIFASGGFYLLMGAGSGVLAAAYGELLHDRQLRDVRYT